MNQRQERFLGKFYVETTYKIILIASVTPWIYGTTAKPITERSLSEFVRGGVTAFKQPFIFIYFLFQKIIRIVIGL